MCMRRRMRRSDTFLCARYLMNYWVELIKFAWIQHWDRMKNSLGFGDLDLIFKVTAMLNRSNLGQI